MSNISTWSPVAASNNTAAPNGFPEGMLPSGVNDAAREVMAAVRRWYEDAQWIDLGVTHTRTGAATFTITGDYTATYTAGRKVRMTGSATAVGTISSSVFSSPNTIVTIAESNVPATLATVSISIVSTAGAPQNLSGLFADGTVGAPGVAFFADSNTGLYRSAADTLAVATGGVQRVTVGAAGNVTVNAPSSGDTLTVNTLNAQGLRIQTTAGSSGAAVVFGQTGQSPAAWYQAASFSDLRGFVNGADRVIISAAGNVTINAPSSGTALTVNANGSSVPFVVNSSASGTAYAVWQSSALTFGTVGDAGALTGAGTGSFALNANTNNLVLATGSAQRVVVGGSGNVTINAPSSGAALAVNGVAGGVALEITAGAATTGVRIVAPSGHDSIQSFFATASREWRAIVRSSGGAFTIRDESAGADRFLISTAGNVTINAPNSGVPLSVTSVSGGGPGIQINGASGLSAYLRLRDGGAGNRDFAVTVGTVAAGTFSIFDETAASARVSINSTGNVTIGAPSSGIGLTISGGGYSVTGDSSVTGTLTATTFSGSGASLTTLNASNLASGTVPSARVAGAYTAITAIGNTASHISIASTGNVTVAAPSSGVHTISGETDARGVAITRIKTADQNISSTITLQNDTHLFCDLTSGRYEFELFLNYRNTATGSAGLQFAFTYSGTALTPVWTYWGTSDGAFIADSLPQLTLTSGPAIPTISIFSAGDWAVIKGTFNASTSGTFRFQWAQVSSSANPTIMMQGSSMKLTKLV